MASMMGYEVAGIIATAVAFAVPGHANAADLSRQRPIELVIQHGDENDNHKFEPNALSLETGKLYKLVLVNASPSKHYFSAPLFSVAIWTRKVQMGGTEVKGAVREIQIGTGEQAEWWFVPIATGTFDLLCTVEGHAENGMIGSITIE
jgi:uncharacterized cupredoxin-like copper-binding protein